MCLVVPDSLRPRGLKPTRLPVHGIFWARILEWIAIPFSNFIYINVTNWISLGLTEVLLFFQIQRAILIIPILLQFGSVQSLSRVRLFATPWIAARQTSLSITISRSSLKLTSIESVMPFSHLILCHPLLLLPPISPSIRVFSNETTPYEEAKALEFQL